jgi:uncharacterized protein involved in response to NO
MCRERLNAWTLAVMTRASLGHTGQALVASVPTQLIYFCAFIAALARIIAAFAPTDNLLYVAAAGWFLAFAGFAAVFGPTLAARPPAWTERR